VNGGDGVLIVGGGLAGQRCAETLRSRGYERPIRIVCAEPPPPYDRPPLSKEILAGEAPDQSAGLRPACWYDENRVELLIGAVATRLDAPAHEVTLADGRILHYAKLLIATGSRARELPFLERFENVHALRTLADVKSLRAQLRPGSRLALVGAGFIGLEAAATARRLGAEVTIIEAAAAPLAAVLGPTVGDRFAELHREAGIDLRTGVVLESARGNGTVEELVLAGGERIACETVLVGIGVAPAVTWLEGSGLELDGGIPTDPAGRTELPDVYAAGDVTRAFDPRIGSHLRTEHWEAAARQGAAAARAMLGDEPAAPPPPTFWSDQYGIRFQYAGYAAIAERTHVDGEPGSRDFSVLYTRDGRAVAALVAGRPREFVALRRRIESELPIPNENGRSSQ
jgi:3-phenylpropionate/trans-cinnamate dioxygenase ferredoxin reductase subunit